MYVNTEVVSALMSLKGVSARDLTRVTGIPHSKIELWLAGHVEDDVLPQSLQSVLLTALGVSDDMLRGDMVHTWDIREPIVGRARNAWRPLETVISAFGGKAEAAYVAAEEDPFFSLTPITVYLLRFPSFLATLRVHSSLMLPCRFSPDEVEGLQWSQGNLGVLLDASDYAQVAGGEIGAKPLQQLLSVDSESSRWDALIRAAQRDQVPPEHLLSLMATYTAFKLATGTTPQQAERTAGVTVG